MGFNTKAKPSAANLKRRMQASREALDDAIRMANERGESDIAMLLAQASDQIATAAHRKGWRTWRLDQAPYYARGGIE